MESNFNNREFEQYVKKNADQYRMVPSEKVWKGINNTLHTRRKWYGIGLGALLLTTAISVTWVMVSYPENSGTAIIQKVTRTAPQPVVNSPMIISETANDEVSNNLPFTNFTKEPFNDDTPVREMGPVNESTSTASAISRIIGGEAAREIIPADKPSVTSEETEQIITATNNNFLFNNPAGLVKSNIAVNKSVWRMPAISKAEKKSDKYTETIYPLTIESVINSYTRPAEKLNRKLSWQLYFAPTVSYRKLSENKSYQSASPFDQVNYPFASLTDINKAVVHKPDMGLELGFATRYPLTKNLKLRGGLQFNVNRYDIKAFVYNGEQATINLSAGNGVNSVTAWTRYRNYDGHKTDWLKNFYFTVSAPLGAELKLLGNDKTHFGIAGTVQPTYILSDRAYLISTDYKNYAEVPWLIRRMNVNTSFETYISYKSRSTRWQVGPQVRYQVLSSFQNKYPVKENLFDFGLKVGITLNQ